MDKPEKDRRVVICTVCKREIEVLKGKVVEHSPRAGTSGVCFGSGVYALDSECRTKSALE